MGVIATLPQSLSTSGAAGATYTTSGFGWHYAINDLPWLSGANRQYPIVRESAPLRKQQFDTASAPGENALDNWWLRSQSSFHGGAGQVFYDIDSNDSTASIRFHSSRNVDVWTQGKVSLLPETTSVSVAGVVDGTEITYTGGTNAAFLVTATQYHIVTGSGAVTSSAWSAGSKAPQSVTTDGSYIYVATAEGVYSSPIGAAPGAMIWTKEYAIPTPPDKNVFLAFVKARIMLAAGQSIYELPPHPAGMPAALPTANYTHPDPAWTWTGITELSNAIYCVGNNGVRGVVVKFVLSNTTGAVPVLSGATVAAELPSGEVVWSAMGYLGAYMGIGTNKGVRIAAADGNGDLSYGPLLFSSSGPVRGWSARDRFLYCGVTAGIEGDSGIYRIDLSTQISELRFAYATDVNVAGDTTSSRVVCHVGASDQYLYGTVNGTYRTHATNKATTGWLRTSRVRYGTLEPKDFRLYKVRGPAPNGGLSVQVLDQYDTAGVAYSYSTTVPPGDSDIAITSPAEPQDFVSLRFTLTRSGTDSAVSPEVWAYQLKALPGGSRQRMVQVPLLCFDWERDSNGNRRGGEGTAMTRLYALESLEREGATVQYQDFVTGETATAAIEQIRFVQDAPPSGASGFGGIVVATLRLL